MDVFLSYSTRNQALATSLSELLSAHGVEVWVAPREIGGGDPWAAEITQAIAKAQVFLLLGTAEAFSSRQVAREVSLAVDANKPILPLVKGTVEIPPDFRYALAGIQRLDIGRESIEESFPRILLALQSRGLSSLDPEKGLAPQPIVAPEILTSEHEQWLLSEGKEGTRAEVHGADLTGASFARRKLARAIFGRCDLSGADFSGSDLSRSTFHGCFLSGASFRGADLRGTRLLECTGLAAGQLAEADLEGAQLPENLGFTSLQRMAGTSKRAGTLLLLVLALCVACAAAIASTSDLSLLTDRISVAGGLILSASAVFIALPGALLALWLFLLLTLQQLWEGFASLPAIFPDGEARHLKADLWLFGSYVQSRSGKITPGDRLRILTFHLLTSLCAPVTSVACWGFYLRRHDHEGVRLLTAILTVSAMLAAYLLARARITFTRSGGGRIGERLPRIAALAASVLLPVLLFFSSAALDGVAVWKPSSIRSFDTRLRRLGKDVLDQLGVPTGLNVREARLSGAQKHLSGVDIKYIDAWKLDAPAIDLRETVAVGAFLIEANLRGARLDSANLQLANLSEADLEGASLTNAHMELVQASATHFQKADLASAHGVEAALPRADFSEASLRFSDFRGADLRGAIFRNADVEGANFYRADLRDADFTDARNVERVKCLTGANVLNARGLDLAMSQFPTLAAESEDEYRQALAALDSAIYGPCGMGTFLGWQIQGPPALRSLGVAPRSLRTEDLEIPQDLPRYLRWDISQFLEGVRESRAVNALQAFTEMKKRLGYQDARGRDSDSLLAERPDTLELVLLQAWPISCANQATGFRMRLGPFPMPRRIDLQEFLISKLGGSYEYLGTESRWTLSRGYVAENAEDGVVYSTCVPKP